MPPNNQQPYQPTSGEVPPQIPGQASQDFAPAAGAPLQAPPPPQPTVISSNTAQAKSQAAKNAKPASTQNSLLLSEVRDDMVVMADGTFRAVIACQSINFDLMSSREREAVEYSYQNFLNALYFPIQILVRSQRVDIGPYIDKLQDIRRSQDNMLLGILMDDYIQFIDILSQEANIMDKSFFIVVPYLPAGDLSSLAEKSKGILGGIIPKPQTSGTVTRIDKNAYEKAKEEIRNRVDSVLNGLSQVGVNAVQLRTKEVGELYYNVYNPDTAVREPLGDFNSITSTYVRRGGDNPQPPAQPGGM